MSGPDYFPWKPPHIDERGSGTAPVGGSTPPPPPADTRRGPWQAPAASAPAGGPAAAPGPPKSNVLGAVSLALALIGLPISFYPPVFHYGWILLLLALILGVIALFPQGQTKGTAIAGVLLGGVGLVASLVFVFIYAGALLWSLFGFTTAPTP